MRKLMRKLLILTALCLTLVAIPAPTQKAQAANVGGDCAVKRAKAELYSAVAFAMCTNWNTRPLCNGALQEFAQAQYDANVACGS